MKKFLSAIVAVVLFGSCQKNIERVEERLSLTASNDALLPLPCHSINFVTDYPINAGQQPPFRFTKTLYSDTRVNTINMLSRAVPNHSAYTKQMWETTGKFSYAVNKGTLTGTKQLWEYYRTPTGAGARRSLQKKNISLTFNFNSKGHVQTVVNNYGQWDPNSQVYRPSVALNIVYAGDIAGSTLPPEAIVHAYLLEGTEGIAPGHFKHYRPLNDQYGNATRFSTIGYSGNPVLTYEYNYSIPRNGKNYSFIPSQNWVSFEYNLCEVMQWLPQPTHQRTRVTVLFDLPNGQQVTQGQVYKNYMFDTKGNQVSLTYGDNILQKTTWYCK